MHVAGRGGDRVCVVCQYWNGYSVPWRIFPLLPVELVAGPVLFASMVSFTLCRVMTSFPPSFPLSFFLSFFLAFFTLLVAVVVALLFASLS